MSTSGSKSSSNSTSNTNQTQTTTPTNPAWVQPQVQQLAGSITQLAGQNPQSFIAGANPLQTQAAQTATQVGQVGNNDLVNAGDVFHNLAATGATGYAPAQATDPMTIFGAKASNYMTPYMDPYVNDVVKSSLADYDYGAGQTQAQNKLALGNDDVFGGSAGGIQTAISNDAINRGRASLASGLRSAGFQQAAANAQQDADRVNQARIADQQNNATFSLANQAANNQAGQFNASQQETAFQRMLAAAGGMANTGSAIDANTRANAGTQADIGSILQQISQNQAGAPLSVLGSLVGDYGNLPLSLFSGNISNLVGTTKGTGSNTSGGFKLG